ncbi:MAG TPA: nucleotide disphospho-sugar-binding domain-containing protein [Polyangia bacterium]
MSQRRRILFVSEAVTLAQVVRLVVLARGLPRDEYEVHFAAAHFDELIFAGTDFRRWPLPSLSPAVIERRVRGGRRLYGLRTLRRYLRDDLAVIDAVKPDAIVGDLRLSLAVAAPLRGIPHLALINAYWSRYAVRDGFPLPDHPIVRLLGEKLAAQYFPRALPAVFKHFAAPVNRLRRENRLPEIGSMPEVLAFGDQTLHPDPFRLVPTEGAPPSHRHLGPVLWAPAVPRPAWWSRLDVQRPTVYVTLGSSGRSELLPAVVDAVAAVGAQALVATAGRASLPNPPAGCHVATYLPGDEAATRADLVISNGGSTTSYQALAAGRPVVGVASNLDQYLAMQAITRAGAGILVRGGSARRETLEAAIRLGLEDATMAARARAWAGDFVTGASNTPAAFVRALDAALGSSRAATA